ncbi:glycosyltransferase [Aminithiophilus ramosus]|uniref:Glycosyltransferase n=2 Tax=Synergistales TaxID=649776 RepID=A0A9Q7EX40_9BACT|nr:glycosyltransferase [Aminithiophilus ramosus]QTX33324.1 glycosyltransferase [Aminithiophilus ramosus]QVL36928.1 glycosyltransferase [Synergistota bacterium]
MGGEGRRSPIRVLRLLGPNRALTARVFEENFTGALAPFVDVSSLPLPPSWPDFFVRQGREVSFFSPNYELEPFVPWLLSLRNERRASARLLFVAHSPGGMAWVWRLMVPHLRPGDRIVAPSRHAASVIVWMEPRLSPFVRVLSHPIPSVESLGKRRGEGQSLLFLGRLRQEKGLHQLLDGYALFLSRRGKGPRLVLAGSLVDEETGRPLAYAEALRHRARRLGLEGLVSFPGPLTGVAREAAFDEALGLCNLSLSLEESFGKAPAEALVRGLPVLATAWSAFPELLGDRGLFVPPRWDEKEGVLSVDAEAVADGLEALLALPRRAPLSAGENPFEPRSVGAAYRALLVEAMEERALPAVASGGSLDAMAPLGAPEGDLFAFHRDECARRLKRMAGEEAPLYGEAERIQGVLGFALHDGLVRLFSQGEPALPSRRALSLPPGEGDSVLFRAATQGMGSDLSRLGTVLALAEGGRLGEARRLLEALPGDGGRARRFVSVRLFLKEGDGAAAFSVWKGREGDWISREESGPWLRLGAEIAREGGIDGARQIRPFLAAWCRRFPDGPESGAVALGWCLAALACGREAVGEGREALERARAVVPDDPLLRRLDLALLGVA